MKRTRISPDMKNTARDIAEVLHDDLLAHVRDVLDADDEDMTIERQFRCAGRRSAAIRAVSEAVLANLTELVEAP